MKYPNDVDVKVAAAVGWLVLAFFEFGPVVIALGIWLVWGRCSEVAQ